MRHRLPTAVCLSLGLCLTAGAQDHGPAIDALFADHAGQAAPGCAVGVFEHGRVVHARGYGMADLEHGVPLTDRSVFDLASTSKQFFAFAVLLLEHDGKLRLDDDVRQHLPELRDYGTPITLRHLLHHTSGIRDYLVLMSLAGLPFANDYPERQVLDLIARQAQLNFVPGSEHLYSNSGYFLLAEVVRRVAGTTPGRFLQERVFGPLGMTATRLYDDHRAIVPDRAIGYLPAGDGFATEFYKFDLVGDGGVLTTVHDLQRWADNFADNRLGGGAELIRRMETPGRLTDGTELDYACGLVIRRWRGLRVVEHGGAWAGYRSQLLRFPEQQLTVAVLSNLGTFDPDTKAMAVAAIALGDRLPPEPPAEPAADAPPAVDAAAPATTAAEAPTDAATLARWVGTYRGASGGIWTIELVDGALQLLAGAETLPLVAVATDRCRVEGGPGPIELTLGGDGQTVDLLVGDGPPRRHRRIEPWTPTPEALAALAGAFHSDELATTWTLAVENGALAVTIGQQDPAPLRPTTTDEFAVAGATVRVVRDGDGRATGLRVSAGRVRDLTFVRR